MDLALTEDQELFRETTRRFLEDTSPIAATRQLEDSADGFDRAWWRRGAELGWTSMLVPESQGGGSLSGEGLADLVIVAEEMGRLVAPGPLLPTNVVADAIARRGRDDQLTLLEGLVAGTSWLAWAFYEGGRWDPTTVRLSAEALPDGGYVLRGAKTLVEAANVASTLLVTARSDGGNLIQLLVPLPSPGVTITPMAGLDLVRRFSTVSFDGVEVPADAVLGAPGDAANDVEHQLQVATAIQCAESVGAMERVFEFTLEYLTDRYSFGRPLASYQALKHRMADNAVHLHECLGTATALARAVQRGGPEAGEMASAAKAWIGEHSTELMQDCVQLHGGIGVTWEHDLHLYLRRATVNRVTYGTPDEHRDRVAAHLGLGERVPA